MGTTENFIPKDQLGVVASIIASSYLTRMPVGTLQKIKVTDLYFRVFEILKADFEGRKDVPFNENLSIIAANLTGAYIQMMPEPAYNDIQERGSTKLTDIYFSILVPLIIESQTK